MKINCNGDCYHINIDNVEYVKVLGESVASIHFVSGAKIPATIEDATALAQKLKQKLHPKVKIEDGPVNKEDLK